MVETSRIQWSKPDISLSFVVSPEQCPHAQICGVLSAVGFALIYELQVKRPGSHDSDTEEGVLGPVDEKF